MNQLMRVQLESDTNFTKMIVHLKTGIDGYILTADIQEIHAFLCLQTILKDYTFGN